MVVNPLPVDRGWAWVVLAACFIRAFMVIGMHKSFGLFFVEYIALFDSNSSMISVIMSIQQIMFSFSSFFILTAGSKYLSPRVLVITGGILMGLGLFLTAYAPTIEFVLFSHGILFGIGQAAASGPSVVVLNSYFEKRRGLANSLSNSGGSLGGLLLPLIIQALLETYALRGTQMVVSALILNVVVSGCLFRPLRIYAPNIDKDIVFDENKEKPKFLDFEISINEKRGTNNNISLSVDDIRIQVLRPEVQTNGHDEAFTKLVPDSSHQRVRAFSENMYDNRNNENITKIEPYSKAIDSKMTSVSNIYGSLADVTSSIQSIFLTKTRTQKGEISSTDSNHDARFVKRCFKALNFSILKNHHLKCLYLISFLAVYGSRLQSAYIPPFAKDCGISSRNISYLVTIIGACDFFGRFAVAWIADSKRIKRTHIVAASLILSGGSAMFNSFFTGFPQFVAFCVVYGLFGGLFNSMLSLLLVECVGAEQLSTALAFNIQINGVSIASMAPILGVIRDQTGTYKVSFYVIGIGMMLAAFILLFIEPIVKKLELNRKEFSRDTQ